MVRVFSSNMFVFLIFFGLLSTAIGGPLEQHKTKECPPGFILKGKDCEAIVIKEPNFVCPRGTTSIDGQCLTFASPKVICPHGFTLSGKQCTKVETAPVQFYCTEGALSVNHKCKLLIPKAPFCPSGYQMDAGHCVRFTPVLKKCPHGFTQQSKECYKKVSFPANPACPEGMELDAAGVKCFRFEQKHPFCPAGYKMDQNIGQCIKFVQKIPASCPHGYKTVGQSCETTEEHPIDILCPADMTLDHSSETCIKEIPVEPKCPPGYVPSQTVHGECERFHPSRPVCPPETVPATPGQCKRKIITEKYPKCPHGFELIGDKCKKVDEFPTRTMCRAGRQVGDQCVTSGSVSPQYACPEGFELTKSSKGPACSRVVQYDCSTTAMKKECEMPDFVQHMPPHNRKLKGEYAPVVSVPVVSHAGKQPVCRQVKVQVPKTCTKQENAPVKYVCPEGTLVGKNCQIDNYEPAMVVCTNGDMDAATGRCLKISIAPVTWHCASGADGGDRICVEYELLPAEYVCPANTVPESDHMGKLKCAERKPLIYFPNKVIKQKAKIVCRIGTLMGRVCVKPVQIPREWQCPPGSTPAESSFGDLKCIVSAELITPPAVEIATPPKYICPDGTPAPNKLCFTTEAAPIEEFCQKGTAFVEGKCVTAVDLVQPPPAVKEIPAIPSCPEGFTLHGSVCKVTQQVPADKVCPAGFDAHFHMGKEACARTHELQAVCPPGSVQSHEGCVTRKHAPPQVTIVKTCTKGTPGCH